MNRAEYIKFLSINDLAEFLVDIGWDCNNCEECDRLSDQPLLKNEHCDDDCVKHCIEWLKSTISDENNSKIISNLAKNHIFYSSEKIKVSKDQRERIKKANKELEPYLKQIKIGG